MTSKPTFKNGRNYDRAIIKKNKLKKNLNSLKRTRGRNDIGLYFMLLSLFDINEAGDVLPLIQMVRFSLDFVHPRHLINPYQQPRFPSSSFSTCY